MAALPIAFGLMVLGGEPQCPIDLRSCYYTFADAEFGHAMNAVGSRLSSSEETTLCNATNWMKRDLCFTDCPLTLTITEPPEMRTKSCLRDNSFSPYLGGNHLDRDHPLSGVEMEFVHPGEMNQQTIEGCHKSDFGNKTYAGKIVVIKRGGCYFYQKFKMASLNGAGIGIMVNNKLTNSLSSQLVSMAGVSDGLDNIPSMGISRHYGDLIIDAMAQGKVVKGKITMTCEPLPELDIANYASDGCPTHSMRGSCGSRDDEEERLCEKCPIEFSVPDMEQKVCLWGNFLVPRQSKNLFDYVNTLPYATTDDEVVVATNLPNNGCSESDFAGLAGKIVFVDEVESCLIFASIRMAQAQGVKAYVVMAPYTDRTPTLANGPSEFVTIPVHAMEPQDVKAFIKSAETHGTSIANVGYSLKDISFEAGVFPPKVDVTAMPTSAPVVHVPTVMLDERSSWQWSTSVTLCLVLICIELLILSGIFYFQRKNAIELPAETGAEGISVPLGIASMGLSLSLLLVIAIVAFSLAYVAGKDSTDTAVDDGRAATESTYDNAVANVDQLSGRMRNLIVDRVLDGLDTYIDRMEACLDTTRSMYYGWDGTWNEFNTLYTMFATYGHESSGIIINLFTVQGFFANEDLKTDDRSDGRRQDGVVGDVATTNNGFLYGIQSRGYDWDLKLTYLRAIHGLWEYNVSTMLGGYHGDPFAITADLPESKRVWHLSKRSFPQMEEYYKQPMSVFGAFYTRDGTYQGTIEVRSTLTRFANIVSSAISERSLENITVVVFDNTDNSVIATNVWYNYQFVGMVLKTSYEGLRELFTMENLPRVEINALAAYLNRTDGYKKHSGQLEQKTEFVPQDFLMQTRIGAKDGKIVDLGLENWDLEMRDGKCGNCVVHDDDLGKEVIQFDGESILYLYTNLTTNTPRVAKSRISAPGEPWKSSIWEYSNLTTFSDGTQCVAYTDYTQYSSRTECLLRYTIPISTYTMSMRIKPAVLYDGSASVSPILFTDSFVGESNVRIFANGQLYMNTLALGCVTRPLEGGFPVNEWSTIAIRVNNDCRVYINGKFHSRGYFTNTMSASRRSYPYYFGRGYKGLMDNIMMFELVLSSTEILGLHTEGKLVRNVAEREYFVETKTAPQSTNRPGATWSVASMIPRDDIMREVDANNVETMENLRIQEENTLKKLRQKSNETIMVIIVIALASVIIFLVFNNFLTRPFASCAVVMTEAAVMKIDALPKEESFITELRAMNRAMNLMMKNLKEYKSYMPQSLQLDATDEGTDHSEEDQGTICQSGRSTRYSTHSGSRSSRVSGSVSYASKAESVKFQAGMAEQKRQGMVCALSKKKFTFLCVNVKSWHERIHKLSDKEVLSLHAGLVHSVLGVFMFSKGISEVFSGDRFVCTFNTAKPLASHRASACAAAFLVQQKVRDEHVLDITASIVSGDGRVGNMGTDMMKRYSFMSTVVPWGYALERYCRAKGLSIIADSYVYEDAKQHYKVKILDEIEFTKRQKAKPIRVAELPGKRDGDGGGEWMYELEANERSDLYRSWNEWVLCIFAGKYEVLFPLLPIFFLRSVQ